MPAANPKIKAAVLDGIAKGWSAKHTALEHGLKEESVRCHARSMDLSFPWQRYGTIPKKSKEKIPLTTLFKRNRATAETAMTQLRKALREMDTKSSAAVQVARVITYLQRRKDPPHWERRIQLTR